MTTSSNLENVISRWLTNEPEPDYRDSLVRLQRLVSSGDQEARSLASEMFDSSLSFGTAGIRGPMRPGPNGMNRPVVCFASAGLARYLLHRVKRNSRKTQVVIGFDGRHHSEIFARDAAEVLSGHGIKAQIMPRPLPTPVLAFAVRRLEADAGVMITASHNPAGDNGLKVYLGGQDEGSQIIPPTDRDIEARIDEAARTMEWSDIPRSPTLVSLVSENLIRQYLTETVDSLRQAPVVLQAPTIVYTAMHGVGGETFLAAMSATGYPEPHVVEDQFDSDADFPTVAFPNPEEEGALNLAFVKARSVSADVIIAHDPDADRLAVGVSEPSAPGGFRTLTGNQVGAILGWHIGERVHSNGKKGTLANSIVSSPVLGKIAKYYELDHEETLTGFKYISRVKNLIFGFEEALGYLVTPDVVRDKDGISAGLMMVSIAHTLAAEKRTLWDYLFEIQESVGAFASGQVTIRLNPGVAGSKVTSALRRKRLSSVGSLLVTRQDDFLLGVGQFPNEDILRYYLDNGTRIIARPSGTEPKVKFYIDTEGETAEEAQLTLAAVEADVEELVSSL